MGTILAAIFKGIVGWFAGWIGGYLTRRKLAKETAAANVAQAKVEQDEQIIHAQQASASIDAEIAKLPDAGPQKLADADPATAAGHLRTDGWLRDNGAEEHDPS